MSASTAIVRLRQNMADVDRLLAIHAELTGTERGRRVGVEVLHKSAVVLITVSWEAFVEDLATEGFDFLLDQANTHDAIPSKVRALVAKSLLREMGQNDLKLWDLADTGWKSVLSGYKQSSVVQYAGNLNTPSSDNVDNLFESLVGIRKISSFWYWPGQAVENSRQRLRDYITVRGQIAHRVATNENINKAYVRAYANFVYRLAVKTANRIRNYVNEQVSDYPWDEAAYEEFV